MTAICWKMSSMLIITRIPPNLQHVQQIVDKHWLVLEVKAQRFIVQLDVSYFRDDVFELTLSPCDRRVAHHRIDSVVILLVLVLQSVCLCLLQILNPIFYPIFNVILNSLLNIRLEGFILLSLLIRSSINSKASFLNLKIP